MLTKTTSSLPPTQQKKSCLDIFCLVKPQFSSYPQSFPASGSFSMSQLFTSGGQSIGASASASVLSMNIQDWFPLGWAGWISLKSKGLSRVFFSTTVQKHLNWLPSLHRHLCLCVAICSSVYHIGLFVLSQPPNVLTSLGPCPGKEAPLGLSLMELSQAGGRATLEPHSLTRSLWADLECPVLSKDNLRVLPTHFFLKTDLGLLGYWVTGSVWKDDQSYRERLMSFRNHTPGCVTPLFSGLPVS